jgi:hypothetical protein
MPFYVGAGDPEWEAYLAQSETDNPVPLFQYIEPWQAGTTVLQFAEAPGAEPEAPQDIVSDIASSRPPAPRPSFFARLFGRQAAAPSLQELVEGANRRRQAACARALWKISSVTATFRAAGVSRVFGSYDGGEDESFTHLHGVEMSDGRVIETEEVRNTAQTVDYDQLVEDAVSALMGHYGAGEFMLRGALVIDFDACTITDEKNADVVFGDKAAWRT